MGRPSKYTIELGIEICERVAMGESVSKICQGEHMPDESQVCRWAINQTMPEVWYEGETDRDASAFSQRYARARQVRLEMRCEGMHDVASDRTRDILEFTNKAGETERRPNSAEVHRAKLIVQTIQWEAAKLLPQYSDRMKHEHSGPDGGPIETKTAIDGLVSELDAVASRQQAADDDAPAEPE